MQITKKQWLVAGVVVVLIVGGLWYMQSRTRVVESPITASSTPESSTSVSPEPAASSTPASVKPAPLTITKFPINPADTITTWSFKGAYTGNDALIKKANDDIALLTSLIGKGQYDDYDLYLGIANDEVYMGDGAGAYQNYNHSIAIHPNKGLAYANLGHLMDELGAYHTAADAYAKAVAVEPTQAQYRTAQLDFLTARFPEEAARLKAKQ